MPASNQLDIARLLELTGLGGVDYHESLDSTQTRAHQLAVNQLAAPLPYLVVADSQTAGRGRGANPWWTGAGSLAISLICDPRAWGLTGELSPERSLAVGVAIVDTVAELLAGQLDGMHVIGLHWPNDVFVGGKKLAGILIDVLPDGRHIVGIGLNVNNSLQGAPAEVSRRATTLLELTGMQFDRTSVLISLLANLEHSLRQTEVDRDWLAQRFGELCLQTGQSLTIEVGTQRTRGVCAGIASDGALLLDTNLGRQKFYSGVLIHDAPL